MKPIIIDLGCGPKKLYGAFGLDCQRLPGVDAVCNFEHALPLKASSVDMVYLSHTVEHIRDLVNVLLPGIGVRPLPVAPSRWSSEGWLAFNANWSKLPDAGTPPLPEVASIVIRWPSWKKL